MPIVVEGVESPVESRVERSRVGSFKGETVRGVEPVALPVRGPLDLPGRAGLVVVDVEDRVVEPTRGADDGDGAVSALFFFSKKEKGDFPPPPPPKKEKKKKLEKKTHLLPRSAAPARTARTSKASRSGPHPRRSNDSEARRTRRRRRRCRIAAATRARRIALGLSGPAPSPKGRTARRGRGRAMRRARSGARPSVPSGATPPRRRVGSPRPNPKDPTFSEARPLPPASLPLRSRSCKALAKRDRSRGPRCRGRSRCAPR